ncbi:MAG: UDP-N-acetylglucosamine--undecaprenyl-phosphate N-acetylglucosaminephosphotransferase [Gammaproteobacteria bacterium]|nr:UDP-N-acetylglucosamine--undecaprenyl-phosphate N-acetylglucosaminephosphotransferase [Gammaproteobacteria bacterium]MBU1725282.1 UDP-N-acetylglucosamine--undecaprenyl-phosphate N-acetylglucosaminephosphotransferase [Gammaproteobacteria bacterium]MBU2006786.1 UDP-N-acetylglucosamine--undecaprenyl-phosphate N-acetylglucosaminephosphotransferase [Gammaproteobacteria bacterium]
MLVLSLLTSLFATWLALTLLKPVALRARLLDLPNGRKQHQGAIPLIGGISIFTGLSVAVLSALPVDHILSTWLLCSLGIVLLGVGDDAEDLSVRLRLTMQILLTCALCSGTGLHLENLGNLLGLGEIHLGVFGYPLSVIAVIAAINCFNMIDGIDGLLGFVSMVTFASLALLFGGHENHFPVYAVALLFIAALVPYLANNLLLPPFKQKVFMGDAGSMLIGFTIIWLLMEGTQRAEPVLRPVTALWLIAIPLMDMARVTLQRIRLGKSPFAAGRDHLHHILQRARLSKIQVVLLITLLASIMAGIGLLSEWRQSNETVMLAGFLLSYYIFQSAVNYLDESGKDLHSLLVRLNPFTQTVRKMPAKSGSK